MAKWSPRFESLFVAKKKYFKPMTSDVECVMFDVEGVMLCNVECLMLSVRDVECVCVMLNV